MAEGSYEYECMRAELLGGDQPDYEEFAQRKRDVDEVRRLAADAEEDAIEAANLQLTDAEAEALHGAGGKLDELNSILSATQKRLDRFKVRCGSVTELIRTKIGMPATSGAEEGAHQHVEDGAAQEVRQQHSQLENAMENNVDKLDALLTKAERAQVSLNTQNKQIKRFLK